MDETLVAVRFDFAERMARSDCEYCQAWLKLARAQPKRENVRLLFVSRSRDVVGLIDAFPGATLRGDRLKASDYE